jgi:uncharacterized protein YdaU (DUF1376 family)
MSGTPFMPLWVADFLADTLELDAKQVGAYMLILMAMWGRDGRLPNDPAKLQRVARCGRDWPRVWAAIGHYFTIDGDQITQDRLCFELQNAVSKRAVILQRAAHGGRAKALKNNDQGLLAASRLALQPESERKEEVFLLCQKEKKEPPDPVRKTPDQATAAAIMKAAGFKPTRFTARRTSPAAAVDQPEDKPKTPDWTATASKADLDQLRAARERNQLIRETREEAAREIK